ncbi:hypothetical protein [uncultured Winogradskyella sp.]|uniref:hypothetical protein n=1 Tax=uncultured Winogradskyella sp. TaxID=395353 RepID=UPI0026146CC5|nr:hypothetical protein [uncultured Winogradskyella sp.]
MKNLLIKLVFVLFAVNLSFSQAWMTNLDIAQKLASVQNKMVLMVWEETTKYQYPVLVKDDKGRTILIDNLFEDETVSPLIWEHFIPVIVKENQYADLYLEIKGKRSQSYIDKFNDDSIKIMDVAGNILNVSGYFEEFPNITKLIKKYALNTEFLELELAGYKKDKNFYSAYYLASKYLDFSLYTNEKIRSEIINLSNIYLNEALAFLESENLSDKLMLKQRCELLKIQEYLILKRPKKVLRQLKKMDAELVENNNKGFVALLYYTAYAILEDEKNIEVWKPKVSLVNLKKADMLINLNS